VGSVWTTASSTHSTWYARIIPLRIISAKQEKQSYFHPFCLVDYDNSTSILVCWEGDNTVSLPDLRTENSTVLNMFNTWITQLVQEYSIDGLRLDSAQEVDMAFFPPFETAGMIPLRVLIAMY